MFVQSVNSQYNQTFGIKYKLSKETVNSIEKSTGLSYKEMTELPLEDAAKLMKERGTLKEPNKIKQWFANKYKQIGERLGLLEKQYNTYTDVD